MKGRIPIISTVAEVAGTYYPNDDGTSRQRAIVQVRLGERLLLSPEPDNPHDPNAVAVFRQTGKQIGYLPRNHALRAVTRLGEGYNVTAVVRELWNSGDPLSGMTRRVKLLLVFSMPGVCEEDVESYIRGANA